MRRSILALAVGLFCNMATATESIPLSVGLALSQCKGLNTGAPSCVATEEPIEDVSIPLALDVDQNVLVGTHVVSQKVNELNISGIVTVYRLLTPQGQPLSQYRYHAEVMSWADGDLSTLTQVNASLEVPSPDLLVKFELKGDVYEKGAYAAQPTLFIGPYGTRP